MSSSENSATIGEWLKFNAISMEFCRKILDQERGMQPRQPRSDRPIDVEICIDAEEAWALVATLFCQFFPEATEVIYQVRDNVPMCLVPNKNKHSQSFTLQQPGAQFPFVSCHFKGQCIDFLHMAHEFAHALQIVASGPVLMPPVAREICAFIGELIVIDQIHLPHLRSALGKLWLHENTVYLQHDLELLDRALNQPNSTYNYRWNYPIARSVAMNIHAEGGDLWPLFKSGSNAASILKFCNDYPNEIGVQQPTSNGAAA